MTNKKFPIGIEGFEDIRTEGFYYVDKTGLIRELLDNWGKVNLFTRPRRFGKTLNMSMLKCFFEIGCNPELFRGLEIEQERELCEDYMGKFPVISISLKGTGSKRFEEARALIADEIRMETLRFQFLLESEKLSDSEKKLYSQLIDVETPLIRLSNDVVEKRIKTLSFLLEKHYGKRVIILIDEYDVPLAKANDYGYYEEMVVLVRNLFEHTLKTNNSMHFAVLTGCLRVSKESIFTGLNNPKVYSVTDIDCDEHFGFTDEEVQRMLSFYGMDDHYEEIKKWYDGYRFGDTEVYCPWDVVSYCGALRTNPKAKPKSYWINTSGNSIIRQFIHMAKGQTRREIECLIAGETVEKEINQELTYQDLYADIDHIWSVLFTTGYLTQRGETEDGRYRLAIPNLEIREIYVKQIKEWFQETARQDRPKLKAFCTAFQRGDAAEVQQGFNEYLMKTISIRDTFVSKARKENFYHGILLGLLSSEEDWYILSNGESGEGYSDIQVEIEQEQIGIVIEVKYSDSDSLEKGCKEALEQIRKNRYEQRLLDEGMKNIYAYGIACHKKHCQVVCEKLER